MYDKIEPTIVMDVPTFVEQVALVTAQVLMRIQPAKHESGLSIPNYVHCRGFVIDILNILIKQHNINLSMTKIKVINKRLKTVYKTLPDFSTPTLEEYHKKILEA